MALKRSPFTGFLVFSFLLASCATGTVKTQILPMETAPLSTQTVEPETEEPVLLTTEITTERPTGIIQDIATPASKETQAQGTPDANGLTGQTPEAVQAAVVSLSQALSTAESQVQVISYEQEQWPDSCLGLAEPGEMCLQVITPGWLIVLHTDGRQYEIHTDETGSRLRVKPGGLR